MIVTSATRPRSASRKRTEAGWVPVMPRTVSSTAARSDAVTSGGGADAQSVRESGSMCVCTLRISGTAARTMPSSRSITSWASARLSSRGSLTCSETS